jgi:cytochrome c-type biogenesis protein CcmE
LKPFKIVMLIIVLLVAGYLILQAFTSVTSPYLEVSEIAKHPERYQGREIQVIGNVTGDFETTTKGLSFTLSDGSSIIRVLYDGPIPQNFMKGIRIVVIGRLNSENYLLAKQILTKCPSKYAT